MTGCSTALASLWAGAGPVCCCLSAAAWCAAPCAGQLLSTGSARSSMQPDDGKEAAHNRLKLRTQRGEVVAVLHGSQLRTPKQHKLWQRGAHPWSAQQTQAQYQ